MYTFKVKLDIIGINPFVLIPNHILSCLFEMAGKEKGFIPVCGTVNNKPFIQTLVRYSGEWRLYINLNMLSQSPKRIGEEIQVEITFDPTDRGIAMPEKLVKALSENSNASSIYSQLAPSLQKEIVRYIARLKTEESVDRNIKRALDFLEGKGSFVGRQKPN